MAGTLALQRAAVLRTAGMAELRYQPRLDWRSTPTTRSSETAFRSSGCSPPTTTRSTRFRTRRRISRPRSTSWRGTVWGKFSSRATCISATSAPTRSTAISTTIRWTNRCTSRVLPKARPCARPDTPVFRPAERPAANTPFPYWRCIAQALLRDEPGEKCNGLLNRSHTGQHSIGFSAQGTWFETTGAWRNQIHRRHGIRPQHRRLPATHRTRISESRPERNRSRRVRRRSYRRQC